MVPILHIFIPSTEHRFFYTLYAFGNYGSKRPVQGGTDFDFIQGSLIFLYYTYPAHRRAYAVRFTDTNGKPLPGLSLPVKVLLHAYASKVDKLKKAVSYISEHFGSPFLLPDIFYLRLELILNQRGKINYEAIRALYEGILWENKKWEEL